MIKLRASIHHRRRQRKFRIGSLLLVLCLIYSQILFDSFAGVDTQNNATSNTSTPTTKVDHETQRFVDKLINSRIETQSPTAAMVAIVHGPTQWGNAYGWADIDQKTRVNDQSLFRIGSISKLFVWLSIMILVDEERLRLDRDINDYLTSFEIPDFDGKAVTLQDLMAHRAGFETSYFSHFNPAQYLSLAEALRISIPTRVAPPGERTAYSNWGADLGALIVQDITGLSFDTFVADRILRPLGMESTLLHDPSTVRNGGVAKIGHLVVKPSRLQNGIAHSRNFLRTEPNYPSGAASLSLVDVQRWMQSLLHETTHAHGQLISSPSYRIMRRRAFPNRPLAPDFAHGFMDFEIGRWRVFGHGGSTHFQSFMLLIPDAALGIFVSLNDSQASPGAFELASQIARHILGPSWETKPNIVAAPLGAAQELAGTYLSNRRAFSGFERAHAIGTDQKIVPIEDGAFFHIRGHKQERYDYIDPDLWQAASGDRIAVERNDGRVARISTNWGTETAEPIGYWQQSQTLFDLCSLVLILSVTILVGEWLCGRRRLLEKAAPKIERYITRFYILTAITWLMAAVLTSIALVHLQSNREVFQTGGYPGTYLWAAWASYQILGVLALMQIPLSWLSITHCRHVRVQRIHRILFSTAVILAALQLAH